MDRPDLRRKRLSEVPPVLRGGFRPFFLGASFWAAFAIAFWLWALEFSVQRLGAFDPLAWHRHEMVFGFVGAAIAGFALTAVPNWTGRPPVAGGPLALLALWWLAARLLPFCFPGAPLAFLAAIDGGFYIALASLILREILEAKNRNVPIAAVIYLFGVANGIDYLGAAGAVGPHLGANLGIALAIVLVSLIGGRIVPSFTRNWMQRVHLAGHLPPQADRFDIAVILLTGIALLVWAASSPEGGPGFLLLGAAILQSVRLLRWRGWRTLASPIVLVLHLSYAWIPAGLFLLAATGLGSGIPASAGIHALTVGAMAGMILSVMTRATLGHTGRELEADVLTRLCYATIQLAVVARVLASVMSEYYQPLLRGAGLLWIAAFTLFLIAYAPKLLGPRVG